MAEEQLRLLLFGGLEVFIQEQLGFLQSYLIELTFYINF